MSDIKIFVNALPLQYVKSTLELKEDNNSFISSFKATHNEFPVIIVKNRNSQLALKVDKINDADYSSTHECFVQQANSLYRGKIVIREVFSNTIKCDLTYSSGVFPVLEQSIRSFMPKYNITGSSYTAYVEETDRDFDDSFWSNYSVSIRSDVDNQDFCLPQMRYENKFGDVDEDDDWYYYLQHVNLYNGTDKKLIRNDIGTTGDLNGVPLNRNVCIPQVFILKPLEYALKSIGYSLKGDFVDQLHIKRTFFYNDQDQMTKITLRGSEFPFDLRNRPWENVAFFIEQKRNIFFFREIGEFDFRFKIRIRSNQIHPTYPQRLLVAHPPNSIQQEFIVQPSTNSIEGTVTIRVTDNQVGTFLAVVLSVHRDSINSIRSYDTRVLKNSQGSILKFNPNVDTSRFVPDIKVSELINGFKNWRNLKIDVDDSEKVLYLNYNNSDIKRSDAIDLSHTRAKIPSFLPSPNSGFYIGYKDEDEDGVLVEKTGLTINGEKDVNTREIINPFKIVPFSITKVNLTESFEKKSAIGLGFCAPRTNDVPVPLKSINGKTLEINGPGGVYESDWNSWITFRLNASSAEIRIPMSIYDINDLVRNKKIYVDNQSFIIKSHSYTKKNEQYLVRLNLESLSF